MLDKLQKLLTTNLTSSSRHHKSSSTLKPCLANDAFVWKPFQKYLFTLKIVATMCGAEPMLDVLMEFVSVSPDMKVIRTMNVDRSLKVRVGMCACPIYTFDLL